MLLSRHLKSISVFKLVIVHVKLFQLNGDFRLHPVVGSNGERAVEGLPKRARSFLELRIDMLFRLLICLELIRHCSIRTFESRVDADVLGQGAHAEPSS